MNVFHDVLIKKFTGTQMIYIPAIDALTDNRQ